jgi:mono/diheme cytochrome c family protein
MTIRDFVSRGLLLGAPLILTALVAASPGSASQAQTPPAPAAPAAPVAPVEAGRAIAERDCSSCHAVGREGESPLEGAPRWRDLHSRFPVDDLAEALAEGISVGHAGMPDGAYEPADVQSLIAYLKSLEPTASASAPK